MADQPAFQIGRHVFPIVQEFNHGDPPLILEVTGLDWDAFSDLLAAAGEEGARPNPLLQTALLAAAVQHTNPGWSRKRVADFVRNLPLGTEDVIGGDSDKPSADDPDSNPEGMVATALPPPESASNFEPSENGSRSLAESAAEDSATSSPASSADPGFSMSSPEYAHPA